MSIRSNQTFEVEVKFLEEDRSQVFYVPINVNGKWLFDEICKSEEILHEKEYFGLRYIQQDGKDCSKTWIDLVKSIHSQLKSSNPKSVSLRVKHYPENPLTDLKLPKSQYLLYNQIKRDLKNGRLIGPKDKMVTIAALVAQVELGDYSVVSKDNKDYLEEFQILHKQTDDLKDGIINAHESLEGLLPSEAANAVFQHCSELDTYGVDPIRVKAKAFENHRCFLGLNQRGILEFLSSNLHSIHEWSNVSKMYCDKKKFIISVTKQDLNNKRKVKRDYEYKCNNALTANSLWSWAEDNKIFFTIEKSDKLRPIKLKRGLFSRSHTFTFSGRTRNEVLNKMNDDNLPSDEMINLMNQFGSQKHLNLIGTDSAMNSLSKNGTRGYVKRPKIPNIYENGDGVLVGDKNDFETESVVSKQTAPGNFAENQMKYATLPNMGKKNKISGYDTIGSMTNKSQASTTTSGKTLQHWQMASFFDLPKRKFIPEAQKRQNKLIKVSEKMKTGGKGEDIVITSEEDDIMTASEALNVDAALGELNQVISEASNRREPGWFSKLFNSIKGKLSNIIGSSNGQNAEKAYQMKPSLSVDRKSEQQIAKKSDVNVNSSWFLTASLIIALSILGFVAVAENDIEPIRSLSVFKGVESSVYVPMKNLILFKKTS